MNQVSRYRFAAALAAIASFGAAAAIAGGATDGYSHLQLPLGLLGAKQLGAVGVVFGLFAFFLPGLVGAWIALQLRQVLPQHSAWSLRIGSQLALLAALAFAAQALFPLDLEGLDVGSSRWHALAWLLWVVAFPCAGVLLGAGMWSQPGARTFALASLLAGSVVLLGGFLGSGWLGAALSQRVAFAAWLLWGAVASLPHGQSVSRGAA